MSGLTYGDGLYDGGPFDYGAVPYVAPSTVPVLVVEFDLTNPPTTLARSWTRVDNYPGVDAQGRTITNRARSAAWTRAGRTKETEQTQAGSLQSLVLDNRDGIFDRLNPDGPFYGALDRSFWIRVSVNVGGITYPRWTGIKDKVLGNRPAGGRDRFVEVVGDDTMKLLELFPLSELSYSLASSGARVSAVLADAQVPVGTVDAGRLALTFPAISFLATDTTSALSHLQQVEQDERGLLFADADGSIVFQNRYYRANARGVGPIAVIGEADGDLRYVESDRTDDAEYLFDVCAITPATSDANPTPVIQVEIDSAFQVDQFARRMDISAATDIEAECHDNAQWYVQRFGNPLPYLAQAQLLGARDPSTWPTILGARNSDLFEVRQNTPGPNWWYCLERVTETYTAGQPLQVFWDLSPAQRDTLWKLGVAGQSELGVSTRLS
jgi:hypothetical protein